MRYVLLKHENQGDFHIDFLLDCGEERLLTWQIGDKSLVNFLIGNEKFFDFSTLPNSIATTVYSNCRRIFDHRRKYLDFSGDLGDDRGYVTCMEHGIWELVELDAKQLVLKTVGTRLADNSPLSRQWQFEPPVTMTLSPDEISLERLMQHLPPPGNGIWVVFCRILC